MTRDRVAKTPSFQTHFLSGSDYGVRQASQGRNLGWNGSGICSFYRFIIPNDF